MKYTNAAIEEIAFQINGELKNIHDALSALDARIERIEAITTAAPPSNSSSKKSKPEPVEAELYVTKESLKKLKQSIMNMFR